MASNYTDKSIDLVAFHGIKPVGYSVLQQNLFIGTSGEVCTGIQKIVQQWLCIFLTPIGSQTFNPLRGTRFMLDIFDAGSESSIFSTFYFANSDAIDQMKAEELVEMPDDERIDDVTLTRLSLYLGTLSLYIHITSKAGESAEIILPIDTNPIVI